MPLQAGLKVGEVFAGHRIEAQIGRGGMGIVYRARHLVLNRDVALKVIAPHLAEDAGFVGRFKKESIVAAEIDHPNVIPIYHAGESDGTYFITMRLVRGTDLRAFLTRQGALDEELALQILTPVAAALDAAHGFALVHRDVKPGNVLLGQPMAQLQVYLTDFGLTKRTISGGGLTKTGQVVGTFDYVAPEQVESGQVDSRTDIYSLGCVFYEILTGEVPFPMSEDAAKLYAHLSKDPPSVVSKRAELSPALDDVIRRAMAKRREDRYESAGAFAEAAVAAVRNSSQSLASPPSAPTAVRPQVRTTNGASVADAPPPAQPSPPPAQPSPPPAQPSPPPAQPSPPPAPLPAAASEAPRPRAARPWAVPALVGAAVLAIAVIAGILVLSGGGGDSGPVSIKVGQTPSDVAVGEGAVWVVNNGDATVTKVDPDSRKTAGSPIAVGDNPQRVAVGEGAIWVARSGSGSAGANLVRIDPKSGDRSGSAIPLHSDAYGLAVGHGAAWVADGRGAVLRVDAGTGKVKEIATGNTPTDVAVDDQLVWVVNSGDGNVVAIDPTSQRVTEGPIRVEARANSIAVADGDLWVLNPEASTVTRIDAGPGHAVDPPARVPNRPAEVAAGKGHAWVAVPDAQELLRFSPGSGTPVTERLSDAPGSVAFGEGAVWVTEDTANRLLRIDPASVR